MSDLCFRNHSVRSQRVRVRYLHSVESMDGVGGVVDSSDAAVGLNQRILT